MQTAGRYLIWTIFLQLVIGFTLSWLTNKKFKGNELLITLVVLPMMLSPAVVGNFWNFLYEPQIGLVNHVVELFTDLPASSLFMLGPGGLVPRSVIIVYTWMWTHFVMLICLAGLQSIPDYVYEAAQVDLASKWRQLWTVTVPMVLPFLMLAVHFRRIENFKTFDMVTLLTGGGPGNENLLSSIEREREAFEKWRTGYSSSCNIILFVTVFGLASIYVKALSRVQER